MSENINYAKGFRPKTWAKIIPFVRPYFKNLAIVTGLMVFAALIDVILPLFQSYAVDNFIVAGTIDGLRPFVLAYLTAIGLSSASTLIFSKQSILVEMGMGCDMKQWNSASRSPKAQSGWASSASKAKCCM